MASVTPLAYHADVVERLSRLEPASWAAFAEAVAVTPVGDVAPVHAELLRRAYRLDPAGHPVVAAAVSRASAALGVDVPVTVYQLEGEPIANASLIDLQDEAVVVLAGNLVELLDEPELTAVLGHELTHQLLWRLDGGRYLIADRLLDALALDARTPAVYLETARRWRLATELLADRGALRACADLRVCISALLKTATGLARVDPDSYLAQAAEADPLRGAQGRTHPETVLRAWALARAVGGVALDGPPDPERAETVVLCPGLDIDRLDLADRAALEALTRRLIAHVLETPWMCTDAVLAHARRFFPDLSPPWPRPASGPTEPGAGGPVWTEPVEPTGDLAEETRRYLGYVLLDFATVDPDLEDEALRAVLGTARLFGLDGAFEKIARLERVVTVAALDALFAPTVIS